ncbi:MAG TPA: mannosyltransferase family protein [Gemmataceae bacterium]|nr:mannosyltransferase family protein [Gemmataceae bacterium]
MASEQPPQKSPLDHVCLGLLAYYLSSLLPLLGVVFGHGYLRPSPGRPHDPDHLLAAFARWDGQWYAQIVREGYTYDEHKNSNVAFFPAYPLLARLTVQATGLAPDLALLLVAHLSLAATFVVLAAYLHQRYRNDAPAVATAALLAFGLLPTTFFFRMAYSESLFLLASVLALYGMQRRWPLLALAGIIGLATATRPVGVALLPPFFLHICQRSSSWGGAAWRCLLWLPLACWGLLAYLAYLYAAFDDPLAFIHTQEHWRVRSAVPLPERLGALLRLEPLWSVFDASSPCYWRRHEPQGNLLFSLHLANPFYFLLAVVLLVLGGCKGWLNRLEMSLAAGLLLIPDVTRSHEMCLCSMGRFAAAVLPMYLVLGQMLARLPAALIALLAGLSGFFLGVYAALFAAWYRFF